MLPRTWKKEVRLRIDRATRRVQGDVEDADRTAAEALAQYAHELGANDSERERLATYAMAYVSKLFPLPPECESQKTHKTAPKTCDLG